MFGLSLWDALGILAIICLLISFGIGKNAIWGGITLGVLIAGIVAIVRLIGSKPFTWELPKRIVIVAVLAGVFFEIIGRLSKSIGNKT